MADRRDRARGTRPCIRPDGWAAHEAEQGTAWRRTTARECLAWLEDAKRFARKAREAARRRSDGDRS